MSFYNQLRKPENKEFNERFTYARQIGVQTLVEKGTPMVQVIPFKRESWKAEYSSLAEGEYDALEDATFGSTIKNHYKRFVWTKKDFK